MIQYGRNTIGEGARIFEPVTLGFPSRDKVGMSDFVGTVIGKDAVLRSGTIIYCDVTIGNAFQTGHNVLIREQTTVGDRVAIGSGAIIEGHTSIGDDASLQSMVYLPTGTTIGDRVFIGPNAVLTNDRYPPGPHASLQAPVIADGAVIGANATILPGIRVGEGALVAAGAVVTKNVPPRMLAVGAPARFRHLPPGAER
ncbi:MAG: N-acetyltransferase [Methanomicrobiaceae archaeon]|nr:N-acetyltransferase [Methanomicrobiaceae archaeon]